MSRPRIGPVVLAAIRAGADHFGATVEATGLDKAQVERAVARLKRLGYINCPKPRLYHVTDAGIARLETGFAPLNRPHNKRKCAGMRARCWWLMRELRQFTVLDLLRTLADPSQRHPEQNVNAYLRGLAAVGVLRKLKRTVGKHPIWRLTRDLGPKAPVVREACGVWDPNKGQLLMPPAQETAHD